MSKLTFTVAAVLAARASAQQQCIQPPLPVPAQGQADYKLQEAANFAYMDQCSADGAISWYEYESFSPDLIQFVTRDEMVRDFQKMDLNNDFQLSAEERLRYLQVQLAPLDLQNHLAPYAPIADELFNYMDCRPQPGSEQPICDNKFDRDDLKAVLPILVDIADIYADHIEYETYISHEFSLRDYNFDGYITRDEQDRHTWHYIFMRYFWNQSKDQGEDNWETVLGDTGFMTYEQWYKQDNRMLRRDYCDDLDLCPIPDHDFDSRFRYFDLNHDGQLSWWEYFTVIQEDDMQYHAWRPFFHSFDDWCEAQIDDETGEEKQVCQDGDGKITMSDTIRTFTAQNEDLTATEILVLAEAFFAKYNNDQETAEIDGQEQQYIGFWEMWGTYHWDQHVEKSLFRRQQKQELTFEQNFWFNHDLNRDMSIDLDELIASGMNNDQAMTLFDHLQIPISLHLDYETTKDGIIGLEEDRTSALIHSWIVLRNDDATVPVTLASIDIDNPHVRQMLQVENQQELTELFVQIDKNSDGNLVFEEACWHYIIELDYFCQDRTEQPRYQPEAGSWDEFIRQIDFEYVVKENEYDHEEIYIEQADWAAAIAEVSLFEDMDVLQLAHQFDLYDLNDDLIVTFEEARQVFQHGKTVEDVVETVEEIWESIDADADGNMTSDEFIQTVNVLTQLELIPLTGAEALEGLYMRELGQYNDARTAAGEEVVTVIPMSQMINMMQTATVAAWLELLDGEGDDNVVEGASNQTEGRGRGGN